MSPIETVNSNRIVLAPIMTRKHNKIRTVKEKDLKMIEYEDGEPRSNTNRGGNQFLYNINFITLH